MAIPIAVLAVVASLFIPQAPLRTGNLAPEPGLEPAVTGAH